MNGKVRSLVCAVFAAVVGCFVCRATARAETIPLDSNCKLSLAVYMNGFLQIVFEGTTALTLTACEAQWRENGAGESAWSGLSTAYFSTLGPGGTDQSRGRFCWFPTVFQKNMDVRFRALAVSGATTNETLWITQSNVRVEPFAITPVAYTKDSSYSVGDLSSLLKDGQHNYIIELGKVAGEWVQLDLGSVRSVAGLRLVPRFAFPGRLANAVVTVADNDQMTGATTVISSSSAARTSGEAVDWVFSKSVSARYIRITSPTKDNWLDFSELEPYSNEPDPSAFSVTARHTAYNDAHPTLSLKAPWGYVTGWTLERGFASTGPWSAVQSGTAQPADILDTLPKTAGALYHYRVRFNCLDKSKKVCQHTPSTSYRLARCLERDWTAPTVLFPGVTVLTDCQVTPKYPTALGFNGKFNDMVATTANPLIGLDFGTACHLTFGFVLSRDSGYGINTPISLWSSNVTPTNTPAAQAADDPNYTELYRTTEPGGAVFKHWYRFPVSEADQTTAFRYAFFHKNAADAAKSEWGNFAEGTFYGYTDADVAAAELIAPESFVGTRTDAGFAFTWTPGCNATTYVLQRKAGTGAWTDIKLYDASVLAGADDDPGASGLVYSYRIKVAKDSETRYSEEYSQFWYERGYGTGLRATYSAPSALASCNPDEVRLGTEKVANINVTKAAGEAVYGSVADNILVAWNGRIIVPFEGDYSFAATATDGFMLEIDGDVYLTDVNVQSAFDTRPCSILNRWSATAGAATQRTSANCHLTAGEHQLRAWWNPTTGAKSCVLSWTMPGCSAEVLPREQLLPADEPEPETHGKEEWRFRTVSSARGYIKDVDDDLIVISEYGRSDAAARLWRDGSFCWKKVSGNNFTLEADLRAPQMFDQFGYLFVSANLNGGACGDDATLMLYRRARRDGVNVRYRTGSGTSAPVQMLPQDHRVVAGGSADTDPGFVWLRLVRRGQHFEMLARQGTAVAGGVAAGENGQWKILATYDDDANRFGRDVYIGFGSTAATGAWVYQGRYVFSNIKLKNPKGLFIILR